MRQTADYANMPLVARTRLFGSSPARQVRYGVAMSLDGYIAGPDGESDWIVHDPDIDLAGIFSRFDTLLIGRKTFESMLKAGRGGAIPGVKSFVVSRTLAPADHPGVAVVRDAEALVTDLKAQPGKDIWLFGGGDLFRSLLDARLVDGVDAAIVPIVLGSGVPFVAPRAARTRLRLTNRRVYETSGIVALQYDTMHD